MMIDDVMCSFRACRAFKSEPRTRGCWGQWQRSLLSSDKRAKHHTPSSSKVSIGCRPTTIDGWIGPGGGRLGHRIPLCARTTATT